MLSFDITDKTLKIIDGREKNGKVKIYSYSSIQLDSGIVVNGEVRDISALAMYIRREIEKKEMTHKEAVLCISSNVVTFKEMDVPKVKNTYFKNVVESKLHQMTNIYEEQSIGYVIADSKEHFEQTAEPSKVLVTSCPKNIIDSFKKVFSILKISLKQVTISCNCISRLVMSDKHYKDMQPMLVVEVDPAFISINAFENGILSFSRFATISSDDYNNKDDYLFEAINENIFRILQFQGIRRSQKITNIIFYGDVTLFDRLSKVLANQGIQSSILKVYNNTLFNRYANAIGGLMPENNLMNSTNLIDVDIDMNKQIQMSTISLAITIGSFFLIGMFLVLIVFSIMKIYQKSMDNKSDKLTSDIDKKIVLETEANKLKSDLAKSVVMKNNLQIATDCINSYPVLRSDLFNQVDKCYGSAQRFVESISYSNGVFSETFNVANQTDASDIVGRLLADGNYFKGCTYSGYAINKKGTVPFDPSYKTSVSLPVKNNAELGKNDKATDTSANAASEDGDKK